MSRLARYYGIIARPKANKKLGNDEHEFNTIVQACGGAKIDVPYIIGHGNVFGLGDGIYLNLS